MARATTVARYFPELQTYGETTANHSKGLSIWMEIFSIQMLHYQNVLRQSSSVGFARLLVAKKMRTESFIRPQYVSYSNTAMQYQHLGARKILRIKESGIIHSGDKVED